MAKDLYEILGVSKDASESEIKKAFRRRARELHPDVNKAADAEDQFKELNEAYDVLSRPNKRAQYRPLRDHPALRAADMAEDPATLTSTTCSAAASAEWATFSRRSSAAKAARADGPRARKAAIWGSACVSR